MAYRINLTATRGCSSNDVRAIMSEVIRPVCNTDDCKPTGELLQLEEHQGWIWFTTSVWGVSGSDLDRGLCKLACPALQFTTSDGDRWYLTVHGGKKGQVHFLHEFGYHSYLPSAEEDEEQARELAEREEQEIVDPRLAFLEDDPPPEGKRPRCPFDLIADNLRDLGAHIPEEFLQQVTDLPYSQAAARYRDWHAEQILLALADAGIPHDPEAVRATLCWENVTEAERGHDLGNLPRLASILGMGGHWDKWVRDAESGTADDDSFPEESQEESDDDDENDAETTTADPQALADSNQHDQSATEDYIREVQAVIEPLGFTTVVDGPVGLRLSHLAILRFFPEALSINAIARVAIGVTLPAPFDMNRLPATNPREIQWIRTEQGFRIGLPNHLWLSRTDFESRLSKEFEKFFINLPDTTMLDIMFSHEENTALQQRYRGQVQGGVWQIAETYPALTRAALNGGLGVAAYYQGDHSRHKLRDETEANGVVLLATLDPNFYRTPVQQRGRVVWCESDVVGNLVKVIFRYRYAKDWDVAAHDVAAARVLRQQLDMQRQMRRSGAEAARRRAAPIGDVLYIGSQTRYWYSDFTRMTDLEQETRAKVDTDMASLGFRHLGDLVAKRQRDIVLRLYINEECTSVGVLMGKRTMYLGYEFYTRFDNGDSLTTTVNSSADSLPDVGLYYKHCPGATVVDLHNQHLRGIGRFWSRRQSKPLPLAATLVAIASEIDDAYARRATVDSEE